MLNQISPMDTFSAAPANPQALELDKHLTKVPKSQTQGQEAQEKEKKWKHKLKKCQKEIRRLSLANVHLDQQLDFFQGNLEEDPSALPGGGTARLLSDACSGDVETSRPGGLHPTDHPAATESGGVSGWPTTSPQTTAAC